MSDLVAENAELRDELARLSASRNEWAKVQNDQRSRAVIAEDKYQQLREGIEALADDPGWQAMRRSAVMAPTAIVVDALCDYAETHYRRAVLSTSSVRGEGR